MKIDNGAQTHRGHKGILAPGVSGLVNGILDEHCISPGLAPCTSQAKGSEILCR